MQRADSERPARPQSAGVGISKPGIAQLGDTKRPPELPWPSVLIRFFFAVAGAGEV